MKHGDKLCMRVGVRYIVTQASKYDEFQVGDHIRLCEDGGIINEQAGGWVDAESVPLATRGMTVSVDAEWLERKREQR